MNTLQTFVLCFASFAVGSGLTVLIGCLVTRFYIYETIVKGSIFYWMRESYKITKL